jgi:hypothetical protein
MKLSAASQPCDIIACQIYTTRWYQYADQQERVFIAQSKIKGCSNWRSFYVDLSCSCQWGDSLSELRPSMGLLLIPRWYMTMEIHWNDTDRENWTLRKACTSVTFSTTISIQTDPVQTQASKVISQWLPAWAIAQTGLSWILQYSVMHRHSTTVVCNSNRVMKQEANNVVHVDGGDCLWTQATKIIPHTWYTSMNSHGGMMLTGKPKNFEKNLSQCHSVDHKFQTQAKTQASAARG